MSGKGGGVGKPARSRGEIVALLIPLVVVGAAGMAISYATLIDVARTNGLPLPEFFPVLIDVGTIACMIAEVQFRRYNIPGRWLAYGMFVALSLVSVYSNSSHALQHADPKHSIGWVVCIIAAIPPAAQIGITHLVMALVPDDKERARLAARNVVVSVTPVPVPAVTEVRTSQSSIAGSRASESRSEDAVRAWILEQVRTTGRRPTGAEVGKRLGLSAKSGQRFLRTIGTDTLSSGPLGAHENIVPV